MFRIIAITALTLPLLATQSKADVTYTYEGMSAQLNLSGLYDAIGSPSETSLINGWTASGNSVNSYDVVIPNPLDERFTLVELLILDAKAQAFLHQTIWGGDDQYHNFLFGAGGYLSMGSVTPVGDQLEFTGYWTTALMGAETELLFTMDTSDGFVSDTEYQFASDLYISGGLASFLLDSGLADTDLTGQWAGSYSGSATIAYVPAPAGLAVLGLMGLAGGRRRR